MTELSPRPPDKAMMRHVAAGRPDRPERREYVSREAVSDRYARFYAPLAIGSVVLAFLPLFEDVVVVGDGWSRHSSYGSVFDMAGRAGGGPAVLGLLLLAGMVVLLVIASFRVRSAVVPSLLVLDAALIAVMLATKPGTGEPKPPLTDGGVAGLVLAGCVAVLGAAHAIHLGTAARRAADGGPDPA